ncbi:MAG: PaaI family thioesterase [Halopseudomonas sp.]
MVTKQQMIEFFRAEFSQNKCEIEAVGGESATIRYPVGLNDLRPGGTVSGPVMMMVADVALYIAILGEIGLVALAVTTNLNINFLRKPAADKDIIGVCKLIKVGKLLAIGEVTLYSEGCEDPVAHAVGTYAIPPVR